MGGGNIGQTGNSQATGADFKFNFDFGQPGMAGIPGVGLMDLGELDLQNLIFGGKSTNNGNVNNVVNFGGDFQQSQLNFNGNMGGGDINQQGGSSATGAGFDFKFDFSGPSMPGIPGGAAPTTLLIL